MMVGWPTYASPSVDKHGGNKMKEDMSKTRNNMLKLFEVDI